MSARFARAAALMVLLLAGAAQAQTMYRCGSTFQDRPCDKGVTEQRITPGGSSRPGGTATSPSAATAASSYAIECSRRGEHAQRIMWQREGGATMERQINEARGNKTMIELVENVYARRGSAPEVRAAVESECVVERQKAAEAAAALRALQQQAGQGGAAPVASAAPAAATQARPAAAAAPAGPDPACRTYAQRKEDIERNLRSGGNVQAMERWQRERRDVERQMSDARC